MAPAAINAAERSTNHMVAIERSHYVIFQCREGIFIAIFIIVN